MLLRPLISKEISHKSEQDLDSLFAAQLAWFWAAVGAAGGGRYRRYWRRRCRRPPPGRSVSTPRCCRPPSSPASWWWWTPARPRTGCGCEQRPTCRLRSPTAGRSRRAAAAGSAAAVSGQPARRHRRRAPSPPDWRRWRTRACTGGAASDWSPPLWGRHRTCVTGAVTGARRS